MKKMTPPLLTKGRYTLIQPFTTDAAVLYTCASLRTFKECEVAGLDVLNEVYIENGLVASDYQRDYKAGALLVTLMSNTESPIFVPDTYIESYPNLGEVTYNHIILAISLGAIPDFLNLTFLQSQIQAITSDVIGITSEVKLVRADSFGVITPEEHEAMEVARLAAIRLRTTDRAKSIDLQRKCSRLEEQNLILVKLLQDNNIIPK